MSFHGVLCKFEDMPLVMISNNDKYEISIVLPRR